MPKEANKSNGLYGMYSVMRTDGRSAPGEKHFNCDYLVLDLTHCEYSRNAAKAFADSCEKDYPLLALDIRKRLQ